ncbi:MAG: hemerythrin family protein [Rhodoferax sp.]|nr:hemerythrin family protein [Rhodoferax sp.]
MDADKKPMADHSALKDRIFVSEWRDSLEVGDAQIDAEHRRLFALVKQLDPQRLDQSVHELKDYVLTHFKNEQDVMRSNGYPRLTAHTDLHEDFKRTLDRLWLNQAPWSEQRVMDLKRFLNEWLIGHIGVHDQHFGSWRKFRQAPLANLSSADGKSVAGRCAAHLCLPTIQKAWRRLAGGAKDSP